MTQKIEPGILVHNRGDLRIEITEKRDGSASGVGDVLAFGVPAGTTGIVLEPEMVLKSLMYPALGTVQVGWRVKFTTHCGPFVLELERVLQDDELIVQTTQEEED